MKKRVIILIIRNIIGFIFLISGLLKLSDLILFYNTLVSFQIIPKYLLNIITVLIPSIEIICGIFLLLNIFNKFISFILLCLLISFNLIIIILISNNSYIYCGCFGPVNIFNTISFYKIIFNSIIMICLLISIYFNNIKINYFMNIKIISIFIITFALIINLNFSYEKLYISINIRNISLIDLKEALNLINNNNAILIDSRNNNSYNKEHIPGALNLPFNNFEGHFKILNNKDRNVNIIIYNDELECSSGLNLAIRLIQKKFNNIFVIKESYEEWKRKI